MVEISNTPYEAVATPATGTLTAGMSASDAKTILNNLGINVNDVLSSGNIQQTINNPTAKPDDLLGIRSDLYNSLGVNTAQSSYQQSLGDVNTAQESLAGTLTTLGGRPVSMSKIVGQKAQASEVASNEINALINKSNLALQNYNAIKSEADTQFGIRENEIAKIQTLQAAYPGAKIKVSDSYDESIKKIDKYSQEIEKKAKKDALKEVARSLGLSTSGSTNKLSNRIRAVNKAALDKANLKSDLEIKSLRTSIANTKSSMGRDSSIKYETRLDANGNLIQLEINASSGEVIKSTIIDKKAGDKFSSSEIVKLQSENTGVNLDPNGTVADNLSLIQQSQNQPGLWGKGGKAGRVIGGVGKIAATGALGLSSAVYQTNPFAPENSKLLKDLVPSSGGNINQLTTNIYDWLWN